jgi:hypothetical protein
LKWRVKTVGKKQKKRVAMVELVERRQYSRRPFSSEYGKRSNRDIIVIMQERDEEKREQSKKGRDHIAKELRGGKVRTEALCNTVARENVLACLQYVEFVPRRGGGVGARNRVRELVPLHRGEAAARGGQRNFEPRLGAETGAQARQSGEFPGRHGEAGARGGGRELRPGRDREAARPEGQRLLDEGGGGEAVSRSGQREHSGVG